MLAYVLLSGGIDSSTALSVAVRDHTARNVRCVSVFYGQRHRKELDSAARLAAFYGRPHEILDLSSIVPSTMLTDPGREIPAVSYAELPEGISPTYVPFRNGLMLSALASHIQGHLPDEERATIYFGAHVGDAQRDAYPDCNFLFTGAMANAIFVGTYQRVILEVPFQFSTKDQIVAIGTKLGTPYHLTWSCYKGGEVHCGVCPTCRSRKEAFTIADVADPTEYVA